MFGIGLLLSITDDTICIINDPKRDVNPFSINNESISIMNRSQLRAARALISWSQEKLADASGVSIATIKRLEPGDGSLQTKVETMEKLQRTLEAAGVEFLNHGQPGVRLRKGKD